MIPEPQAEAKLGELTIVLPTATEARCSIMHDLAGFLRVETNAEAHDRFRAAWRASGNKGRLDLDHEADFVFVHAGREPIVEVALCIHRLAGIPVDEAELAAARSLIKAHRRPPRVRWKVGDVFAVPLGDSGFAFGQVLGEEAFAPGSVVRAPTCALFDFRRTNTEVDVEEVLTSRTLAILHESSTELDSGAWRCVANREPVDDPASGPCGRSAFEIGGISGSHLEALAAAWFGIEPWNVLHREDYWERFLLRGVPRSPHALLLDAQARAEYRLTRWGVKR